MEKITFVSVGAGLVPALMCKCVVFILADGIKSHVDMGTHKRRPYVFIGKAV